MGKIADLKAEARRLFVEERQPVEVIAEMVGRTVSTVEAWRAEGGWLKTLKEYDQHRPINMTHRLQEQLARLLEMEVEPDGVCKWSQAVANLDKAIRRLKAEKASPDLVVEAIEGFGDFVGGCEEFSAEEREVIARGIEAWVNHLRRRQSHGA